MIVYFKIVCTVLYWGDDIFADGSDFLSCVNFYILRRAHTDCNFYHDILKGTVNSMDSHV